MRRNLVCALVGCVLALNLTAVSPGEALAGRWLLRSQEVAGQATDPGTLMLRITKAGDIFEFSYSVPVDHTQSVSLTFSARLDGMPADVKDSHGNKIGTVQVTKAGASLYKVVLQGPDRPTATGTMAVSRDGGTLTSQSDSSPPGQSSVIHTLQVFTRQ